jgi:hypothetical protein
MRRSGVADLPLHDGRAPSWLYERMAYLGRLILQALIEEEGTEGVLRRFADPFWFQSLGALLGMDWHSSGVTTTLLGALKEGFSPLAREYGLFICGGKGGRGLKTPEEIAYHAERIGIEGSTLVEVCRLVARVDSRFLQDGYDLYHHCLIFDRKGNWAVIQQGMNPSSRLARRYHWLSFGLRSFWEEPHSGIEGTRERWVMDLTSRHSQKNLQGILELFQFPAHQVACELNRLPYLRLPHHHAIFVRRIDPRRLNTILLKTYENPPQAIDDLLRKDGLGPRTLRALSLLSELLFGAPPSFRDPARFAFAHGGKDGHPYPVDLATYDRTIATLKGAVMRAKMGRTEKLELLRRLPTLFGTSISC